MSKLLISRSRHDACNEYLYAYSEEIITSAKSRGWQVERADCTDNTKANLSSRLANKPQLVVLNGHGSADEVYGHDDQATISRGNSHVLAGTVSFIRACGCLGGLGKAAVKAGAKAVAGYNGDFWISKTNKYAARPLQDTTAKPVLDASNKVALKLVKGSTVKEAVEASKALTNELVLKMITREEPYESATLKALMFNSLQLGFEGEGTSKA